MTTILIGDVCTRVPYMFPLRLRPLFFQFGTWDKRNVAGLSQIRDNRWREGPLFLKNANKITYNAHTV